MKIYIVSNGLNYTSDQFVKQLASIKLQVTKATPVVVVDERHTVDRALVEQADVPNSAFHLDNYLHEKGSIYDGVMLVDANQITSKLSALDSEWVVFEFGQNYQQTCIDFLHKLARYNYMTPTLRNKNIVFSVPSVHLDYFARTISESFNNLPVNSYSVMRSGQVGMLMISSRIESLFFSFPLLFKPLLRLKRYIVFIYRRLKKADSSTKYNKDQPLS